MHLKSIRTKLFAFYGVLLLVICVGIGTVSYVATTNALTSSIRESLSQLSKECAKVVESRVDSQLNAMEVLANSDSIKGEKLTLDEKLSILENEVERSGHKRMGIADTNGSVRYTDGETLDISGKNYFETALSGKRAVSDPSKENKNMVLYYAVPIKNGSSIKGVLLATRDGNELSVLTSDISLGKNGSAFMINSKGVKVAYKDENLIIKMDNDFDNIKKDPSLEPLVKLERQMAGGESGVGAYTYHGITKFMGYAPVEGTNWFLAITSPKSEAMAKAEVLAWTDFFMSIIFIIAGSLITFLIAMSIAKPIKKATDYLKVVATGDLSAEVPEGLLKMKDETGILANSINMTKESIKGIVKEVIKEASDLSGMLVSIHSEMEQLNKEVEVITATTQELSAGTEETASSTEEMNATSSEIEQAAESIASKAQEGAAAVGNVSRMAEEMKRNAISSRENTVEIYEKAKNNLNVAIEESKSVNQINELSEAILEITSQTNLLALNAAIEAARAGEAGKGFAVVAEEIRKLAESSKNTVTRIKEITRIILDAVKNLTLSSDDVMQFIDKQVLKDYESLIDISGQYSRSSAGISDIVTDFSATSEELLASVQNMSKAINEISDASNEEAQGASDIVQDTSVISQKSGNVAKLAERARKDSELLLNAVSKFKV